MGGELGTGVAVGPGDRPVGVHVGMPEPNGLHVVMEHAQQREVDPDRPPAGGRVRVVERDLVVDLAGTGRLVAVREPAVVVVFVDQSRSDCDGAYVSAPRGGPGAGV